MVEIFFLVLSFIPLHSLIYHIKIDKSLVVISNPNVVKKVLLFFILFFYLFLAFLLGNTFIIYVFFVLLWSSSMIKTSALGIGNEGIFAYLGKRGYIKYVPFKDIKYVIMKTVDKDVILEVRGDNIFFMQKFPLSDEGNIFEILNNQEHIKLIKK